MTEHTKEVELGGEEMEIVYNDEDNLVYKRQTKKQLKEAVIPEIDDMEYFNDENTWGYDSDIGVEQLEELADRAGLSYSDVHITPQYLREMAEELEMVDGRYSSAKLRVCDNMPVIVEADHEDATFILMPRIKDKDDFPLQ